MKLFELTNFQRRYLGLEPIESFYERTWLGNNCILYFHEEILVRIIITEERRYSEIQCQVKTENKEVLLPVTAKGKVKKITFANIEKITPIGMAFNWNGNDDYNDVQIINHSSKKEFYSTYMENLKILNLSALRVWIDYFINESNTNYLDELDAFKQEKRKNIQYKEGDFFAFKINRYQYGFGRILMDVHKTIKKNLLSCEHGLNQFMYKGIIVKIYHYISSGTDINLNDLKKRKALPSICIIDNYIFYGDHKIIGHQDLDSTELDFPISYGLNWNADRKPNNTYLTWGLIHLEMSYKQYNRYTIHDNQFIELCEKEYNQPNTYPLFINFSISTGLGIKTADLLACISSQSNASYWSKNSEFFDLRNPIHDKIRGEIFHQFKLDGDKSYEENIKNYESLFE